MPIRDEDLEYLRNINTRPGPSAGHSIDPTKPGPDDVYDKIKGHAVTQSDTEPVAWQTKAPDDIFWRTWPHKRKPGVDPNFFEIRPLYTAPPRPDASAGLIEAAEMAEECASECLGVKAPLSAYALRDFAKVLRARAANRSGPTDYIPIGGAGNGA